MSTYTISTTESLINGTHGLTGLQAGDEIDTLGYYSENDGGGAEFVVEAGTAEEGSYFEYTLVNNDTVKLKAVMVIKNDTVNIDQLGAKGDAVIPEETDGYNSTYLNQLFSANTNSFDNSNIMSLALSTPGISTVTLSSGKKYGARSTIYASGGSNDKMTIIGNGSSVVEISNQGYPLLQVTDFANFAISDIELLKGTGQSLSAAILVQNVGNAKISKATVKSLCVGINGTEVFQPCSLNVDRCNISSKSYGIYCKGMKNSNITNVNINGFGSGNGMEFWINNENIKISNAFVTDAQTAVSFSAASGNESKNCTVCDIVAENCSSVFKFSHAQNIIVNSVIAHDISKVASFSNAENISICDGIFSSPTDSTSDCAFTHSNGVCSDISFAGCSFDFNTQWFKTTHTASSAGKKAHIAFSNCSFNLRNSTSDASIEPAKIEGGTLDVDFTDCCFYVEKYATPVSGSEYMFYFKPTSSSCPVHYWNFSDCSFKHGTNISVKSPILIDSQKDTYEKTFVTVRNSNLKDFDQVMHLSGITYDETDIETVFNDKQRYLSDNNCYVFTESAEEYGLSE